MLKLYDKQMNFIKTIAEYNELQITEELNTGYKVAQFQLPYEVGLVQEEQKIEINDYLYVIKEVNMEDNDYYEVFCKPYWGKLLGKHIDSLTGYSYSLQTCLDEVLAETDWTYKFEQAVSGVYTVKIERKSALDAIAAFFFKIIDDDLFLTTPWETRAKIIGDEFGIEVSDRTLRKYNAKLVEKNIIIKDDSQYEYWYTTYVCGEKYQDVVGTSEEEEVAAMEDWFNKRKEYLEAADLEYSQAIGVADSRNPNRWKIAMNKLWETTKIVYYKVKGWNFNAFEDADLKEIYRLSALVVADIEIPEEAEEVVEEQVKFNPMNNCTGPNGEFIF
jgi:hypothetical protein